MKPTRPTLFRAATASAMALIAATQTPLSAAPLFWDNVGGATVNAWGPIENWSTVIAGGTNPTAIPSATDVATFSASNITTAQAIVLNASRVAQGLDFTSGQAHTFAGGSGNYTLTLGASGITKSGTGAATVGSATANQNVAVALAADQTWTNSNNTGAITVVNGVSSSVAGARLLTLGGTSTATNTISGVIANGSGTVSLAKTGAGLWVLGGANTFTGNVTVSDGTLRLSTVGTSLGAGTAILVQNAENPATSNTNVLQLTGGFTFGTGKTITLRNNSTSNIGNARVALENNSGNNTWAGNIVVDQGTNQTIQSTAGTFTVTGNLSQSGTPSTSVFIRGAGTGVYTGSINLGTAVLYKTDAGTWTIGSTGNTMGTVQLGNSTLILNATNALGTTSPLVLGEGNGNNTTVTINSGFSQEFSALSNAPTSTGRHTIGGLGALSTGSTDKTLTVTNGTAADDFTISSGITGTGTLIKTGAGLLVLSNVTSTAPLSISGPLAIGATGSTVGATLTTTSLNLDNTSVNLDIGTGGDIISSGTVTATGTNTFNLNQFGALPAAVYPLLSYTGTTPGLASFSLGTVPPRATGSLVDTGSAIAYNLTAKDTLYWTGINTANWATGATGNWNLTSDNSATDFLVGDTVIFGDSPTTSAVAIAANVSPAFVNFTNTTATAYTLSGAGGIIGSTTSLTKSGNGLLTLDGTGAHSYAGATTVSAGTLAVNFAASTLSGTSGVSLASGATLRLFANNAADQTFSRNLSGAGTLVVDANAAGIAGSRMLTLSGTNTGFTGAIQITPSGDLATNGSMRLAANQVALGASTVTVANRGQLWITSDITNNVTLSGAGFSEVAGGTLPVTVAGADGSSPTAPALAYAGIGAIRMNANNIISGNITLAATAKIMPYNTTGTISGSITNTNPTDDFVVGGGAASSTLILTGDNSGLDRIWVNGGSTATANLTHTLVVGNNTTTGTIGSGDVILYNDITTTFTSGAVIRFQRTDGYTLVNGQDIIAAHNGTATNLARATVQINTIGGFNVGNGGNINVIDLSDGTNGGSINVGNNLTGSVMNIGAGATIEALYFGVGEQTNNSATVNQTGGSVAINGLAANTNNNLRLGHWGTETSTYNLSGGTLSFNAAPPAASPSTVGNAELGGGIYVGLDGQGIFNQTGGTVSTNWVVLDNRGDTVAGANMVTGIDQYNLSAGTLELKSQYGIIARNLSAELNVSGGTISNTAADTTDAAINSVVNTSAATTTTLDTVNGTKKFSLMNNITGTGTLALSGGGTVELEPDSNAIRTGTSTGTGTQTITASFSGTNTIAKLGTGTTTLSGDNSGYTGNLNVSAGRLNLTGQSEATVFVATGGTLGGEGSSTSLDLASATLGLDASTGGAFTTGSLSATGVTTVSIEAPATDSNPVTVLNFGIAPGVTSGNFALANSANYRSAIFNVGANSVTLTPGVVSQSWTGETSGVWDLGLTDNWSDASGKFFYGDTVTFNDAGANPLITLTGSLQAASVIVDASVNNYVFTASSGNVLSGGGNLLKKGSATLTMAGNVGNTFTGGTTISQGTINVQNIGSLGTAQIKLGDISTGSANTGLHLDTNRPATGTFVTNVAVTANGTGTATLGSRATIVGPTTGVMGFNGIALAKDVTFDSNAFDRTDYYTISGTGNINVTGVGRTILLNTNTFVGNITVNVGVGGTFQTGAATAGNQNYIPDTSSLIVNDTPGNTLAEYRLSSGGETIAGLSGSGTIDANAINGVLTVGNGDVSSLFSGQIVNGGANTVGLTKIGTGTLTLAGTNTTTGATTVNAGTLVIGNGASSGSIGGALAVAAGATATVDRSDASALVGLLSGLGTFNKNGAGDLSLNGAFGTFSGIVNVNGGSLVYGATNPTGTALVAAAFNLASGTTLTNTNASTHGHVGTITMAGGSTWTTGTGTGSYDSENYQLNGTVTVAGGSTGALITRDASRTDANSGIALRGPITFNVGAITSGIDLTVSTELENPDAGTVTAAGPGAITKTGNGVMELANANSYTGGTTVNAGTLRLGNPAALGTGPATVASGGTINMGGNTIANVVTLAAGSTLIGNGTLTAAADTVAGNIAPGTGNGTGTINFFNSGLNLSGNCAMQIDGNGSNDVITSSGNLGVSGTVTVTFVNGYVPAVGHTFDLFSQPNSLGISATLSLPVLPTGLAWNTSTFSSTGVLSIINPYADFVLINNLLGPDALPDADPDKDGISNFLEFAFGINPNIGNNGAEYRGVASTNAGALTLAYRRPVGGVPGVIYGVEFKTTDLVVGNTGWSLGVLNTDYTQNVFNNGDGTETVTISLAGTVSGKKFARIFVTN